MAIFGMGSSNDDDKNDETKASEGTNTDNTDNDAGTTKDDTDTPAVDETSVPEAVAEVEKSQGRRQCQGLFVMKEASEFTQNEKYSDEYLKSKGLFKGE